MRAADVEDSRRFAIWPPIMALVFISHAHRDEVLARKVVVLLSDALGMKTDDFFLSSEAGHGVAPSAGIRASIANELRKVPALVVLLTPKAAASPWVWVEAGERLGCTDQKPPIFVIPSARFVSLLAPVADLRCLQLDDDGELHELVRAVGSGVGRPVLDVLSYKPALDDLMQCSDQFYSLSVERKQRVSAWLRTNLLGLILAVAGVGMLASYAAWRTTRIPEPIAPSTDVDALMNYSTDVTKDVSRFLVVKGHVIAGGRPLHDAVVMVSLQQVRDPSACLEPDCTKDNTTTLGEFTLGLTRIKATDGDRVVLSVAKPGFAFFSRELDVDVRATDAGTAPQTVELIPAPPQ